MENQESENQIEMPRYKCHKEAWALKIKRVRTDADTPTKTKGEQLGGAAVLEFEDTLYAPRQVGAAFVEKHNPAPGDYFVVYKDGYQSISPARVFEDGYSPI